MAPRIRKAIEIDNLDTGFTFMRTGAELDREAILGLEREKIIAVICQTDRRGGFASGIRRVQKQRWLIGVNARNEPIALVWNGTTNSRVTTKIINASLAEAKKLNLKTPLRIYGTTSTVSETRSFRFCQIPDEILAALVTREPTDGSEADGNAPA